MRQLDIASREAERAWESGTGSAPRREAQGLNGLRQSLLGLPSQL